MVTLLPAVSKIAPLAAMLAALRPCSRLALEAVVRSVPPLKLTVLTALAVLLPTIALLTESVPPLRLIVPTAAPLVGLPDASRNAGFAPEDWTASVPPLRVRMPVDVAAIFVLLLSRPSHTAVPLVATIWLVASRLPIVSV